MPETVLFFHEKNSGQATQNLQLMKKFAIGANIFGSVKSYHRMKAIKLILSLFAVMALTLSTPLHAKDCGSCESGKKTEKKDCGDKKECSKDKKHCGDKKC